MNLKDSKFILTLSISTLVVVLALFIFSIYYMRNKAVETNIINEKVNESNLENSLVDSLKSMREESRDELESFEDLVLSANDLVPLIENLEDTGEALGLTVEVNSVNKSSRESLPLEVELLSIVLTADGSWRGVYSLLKSIENLPYPISFDKVSYSNSEGVWRTNISFSTYIFHE